MGPQTGYNAPQILMEQDVHAPGIDARGASFAGVNQYVTLGRGRDYTFSATAAGQDITDTFAVPLCDPAGGRARMSSAGYPLARPVRALRGAQAGQSLEAQRRGRDAGGF
jgi:acyl-homoserine lactone acylase PvdQ